MTHEQAVAEMVIDAIHEQIKFTRAAGMSKANLEALVESINGVIAIYNETRASLKEIDNRVAL